MSLFLIDAGREWRGSQRLSFQIAKEMQKKGCDFVQKKFSARSMADKVIQLYEKEAEKKDIMLNRRTDGVYRLSG